MSPALRALLAGVLISAGGVAVYTYSQSSTTFADLQAAGIGTDCNPRLIICSERVNPVLRNRLADGGYPLPAQRKYARVVRQAFNCPNPDGGVRELVVPGFEHLTAGNDDALVPEPFRCIDRPCTDLPGFCGSGPKNVGLASAIVTFGAPPCVRAPLDGGTDCRAQGYELDGGARFIGTGNVFPSAVATGTQCEQVECTVMSGDNPETDL
jgi:hypothetical protein